MSAADPQIEPSASHLPAAPWDRTSRIVLACLAFAFTVSSFWLVHPWYEAGVETNDASMYILSAQALLRGEGYAYLDRAMIIRPPGMSLFLAPILHWRGLDFAALNLVSHVFGVVGALLFFVWTRPRLGTWVAAAATLCLWFNPGWRHFSNQVMSDVPGAALILGALILERWAARASGWRREVVLGVFIGISTYMRTVLVLLVPAILLARAIEHLRARNTAFTWIRFVRSRVLPLVLATAAAMAPWSVRNSIQAPAPPADQNFIYSYGTGMFHSNPRDPSSPPRPIGGVIAKFPTRARATLDALGNRFEGRAAPIPAWILGAWIVAAVVFVLVRSARSAEIYFFVVAALLLVYFGYRDRLVLPMYVVALAAFAEAHIVILSRWLRARSARAAVAVALVALTIVDFQPRKGWDEIEADHESRVGQADAWTRALDGATRLASNIGWHHSVYLGRPVWSLYYAVASSPTDVDARGGRRDDASKALAVLDKYGIEAIVLSNEPQDRVWIPLFEQHFGPAIQAGLGCVFRIRR